MRIGVYYKLEGQLHKADGRMAISRKKGGGKMMTLYEAMIIALQSNLVFISVITLILIIVKERKK